MAARVRASSSNAPAVVGVDHALGDEQVEQRRGDGAAGDAHSHGLRIGVGHGSPPDMRG